MLDRNQDGHLTRAEIIISCKKKPHLAKLLGLPESIGDDARDAFEKVF
jgi:hypothetical protein